MGKVIFITGGVRSGKSAFAENIAKDIYIENNSEKLIYIASGVAFDDEMEKRIRRHMQDREASEIKWTTIECVNELPKEIGTFQRNSVILWDCITTWLSNVLYKTEVIQTSKRFVEIENYLNQLKQQIMMWKRQGLAVILVSNEVLDEQVSKFKEVNLYRRILGSLHQWLVSICDEAYEMDYSLIRQWK